MIALILSDIHSNREKLEKANEIIHNRKIGLVLLLGDLTQMGGAKEAREVINALKPARLLAFAGNFELPEVQQEIEKQGISLHAKKLRIGKWTLVGFGGSMHNDPGRFLFSEQEIKETLQKLIAGEKNAILLTHVPPYGTKLDFAHIGKHIGSKSVREIIEKYQPALHLCGHCHEAPGEEKIGATTSINVGAVKDGKALLLELDGKLKWEKIEL